ncbi:Aste57867_14205 [Aphanomyces stellatus]|uniref:Aste57867_14205 protein n=1 Tax=Aphanomyces stellatus TaxID=120398 RepID=A0A485L2B5_9STRA|nr:hypothetical protein As57867_014154 [Aphanomyces stellatus]VFT91030.1 Aste57867_14205 [Aphanomyces stellatus]
MEPRSSIDCLVYSDSAQDADHIESASSTDDPSESRPDDRNSSNLDELTEARPMFVDFESLATQPHDSSQHEPFSSQAEACDLSLAPPRKSDDRNSSRLDELTEARSMSEDYENFVTHSSQLVSYQGHTVTRKQGLAT